ncbi:disulfide bond formation protein DsbB [Pseudomonas hunanensis]|uniref:Disulfide bond formation protein DsbB n=1 Tax=Pseudomonas hunanensis TaxID=1247546 RepID=A0ACC6JWE6_9PSED|nr:disulfide bond formation protein B [Pseudomonas hunanensis]MDR6710518.1 disulfide bond formation protein DsbB [Pseudomonas hunanensis]
MSLARFRTFFLPGLLAALAILIVTLRLQSSLGLMPCALCYSQRLLLSLYALVCLVALIHGPGRSGWHVYAWLALSCSVGGALLAARHVWLQGSDALMGACGQPLGALFEHSWRQAFEVLLLGGPDCGALAWSFLDLTLPEWSLLAFLLLAMLPLSRLLAYRFRNLARL